MSRLYTYIVPVDDGAAPNPFNGMCSLAICKPTIRRTAQVGDWVAGFGSTNAPSGDLSGRLIYAMRVEESLSLEEYDDQAPRRWRHRIPNVESSALQERLGDCLYDFSQGSPRQRRGVHNSDNQATDLRGQNVLISRDFYYFGRSAEQLPTNLRPIIHQGQGHRSTANQPYFDAFARWVRSFSATKGNGQLGWPDFVIDWSARDLPCSIVRREDDEDDEERW